MDDVVARVIELYEAGSHTLAEIEEETGKSRSMIYYHLRAAGIDPNRQRSRNTSAELQGLLDRLDDARQEIVRLRAESADLRDQLDRANRIIDSKLG